jgi:hypothetical protein
MLGFGAKWGAFGLADDRCRARVGEQLASAAAPTPITLLEEPAPRNVARMLPAI